MAANSQNGSAMDILRELEAYDEMIKKQAALKKRAREQMYSIDKEPDSFDRGYAASPLRFLLSPDCLLVACICLFWWFVSLWLLRVLFLIGLRFWFFATGVKAAQFGILLPAVKWAFRRAVIAAPLTVLVLYIKNHDSSKTRIASANSIIERNNKLLDESLQADEDAENAGRKAQNLLLRLPEKYRTSYHRKNMQLYLKKLGRTGRLDRLTRREFFDLYEKYDAECQKQVRIQMDKEAERKAREENWKSEQRRKKTQESALSFVDELLCPVDPIEAAAYWEELEKNDLEREIAASREERMLRDYEYMMRSISDDQYEDDV